MTEAMYNSESVTPIISATLALDAFKSDWQHCDQLSNYLAQFMSLDRHNPTIFINRLSTAINEVLEVVYHYNSGIGTAVISVGTRNSDIHLEFAVPVNEADRRFYDEALDSLAKEDPRVLYRRELERLFTEEPHPAMGLYELAADYGARFEKRQSDDSKVTVVMSLSVSNDEG